MTTIRQPALVWTEASGACTAVLVGDWEGTSATGGTEAEVVRQLKELLEWRAANEPWMLEEDLVDAKLLHVDVEVRPQYRTRQRVFPCREALRLRMPCVIGRPSSGLQSCMVPHLGVQFSYRDDADLQELVEHYVGEELQDLTPSELALRLPPAASRLVEIVAKADRGTKPDTEETSEAFRLLSRLAEPVLGMPGQRSSGSSVHGRDAIIARIAEGLGSSRANILVVGEPGAGKSAVLAAAARQLARGVDGEGGGGGESGAGRGGRFWRTSAGRIVAGMRYLGEWEERCEKFVEALRNAGGILFVESLLELVSLGGEGPADSVGAFLLPYLQRGDLRMAAEASPTELEACRRLLPGLLDVFRQIPLPAFSESEAVGVLGRICGSRAATSKLEIEAGVPPLIHRLFRRFQPYLAFPGPAAEFARSLVKAAGRPRESAGRVGVDDVLKAFVARTGLPESMLRDEWTLRLEEVQARFASRIVGQRSATDVAARVVMSMKAGLTDPERPQGVLLFCGPTGVGKTALARELVEFCFGGGTEKDRLVRLDMSEYGAGGAAARLLHDPRGRTAAWIERVRRQPFCVVLFDEIEKAAPEVFDVLLSLLDEGRLTDRFGRVTWFRGALVVMTSNLGADARSLGGFATETESGHAAEVARFFRPEFFNRLDAVVTFRPLATGDMEEIVRKELAELSTREGLVAAGLSARWTDELVTWLAREGYDARFGARPLQRAMERWVVTPLARWRVTHPGVRNVALEVGVSGGKVAVRVRDGG